MSRIRFLIYTGYVEAASFLLLLGFAMPLKYVFDMPQFVSVIGWAHGMLFIFYVLTLVVVSITDRLVWWSIPAGFVGAVIPFGPFIYDRMLATNGRAA